MRRLAIALALFLFAAPAAAERIERFDVRISLGQAYDFEVEERIRWDFEGAEKHGIFRRIPTHYARGPAADYRITVNVQSVTDENGVPWRFAERQRGPELELKIGDPNVKVSGIRTYVIRYRVGRAILYFPEHDELYWNATGTDWPVVVETATADVHLPPGASPSLARRTCFAGPAGSNDSACTARDADGAVEFASNAPLPPGAGLTVVVGLPKGILPQPSAARQGLERASDFFSVWLLLPLGTLAFVWRRWRTHGRDPGGLGAIPVRYEPPEGLTPAEIGTVLDERADMRDLTATILDLAVRGHLHIEEIESTRFLFLSNRDYKLVRHEIPAEGLKEHERKLLAALFAGGSPVLLSGLESRFYVHVPGITTALYGVVCGAEGLFANSPEKVRGHYRLAAAAVLALGFFVFVADQSLAAALSIVATAAIVFFAADAMPRRTLRGRRARDEILGFREFVRRVDADRLERTGGRTAERFEKLLPYALVLGVADPWANAFSGIYTKPPDWYRSPRYGPDFRPRDFVSDVGRSLSTLGQTLSSRPASSGSGSGSSGFSSSGSSGGGFGGGGGGSW